MSLNSSSEFSQRTDRGRLQTGTDPEEREVKMNMEEDKGEKVKGEKVKEEKGEGVKENIEKIMEDANGVKDGPIRSSL